jgi:FKBP-type peptidyl-prolyl cis-trans isomerase
MEAKKIAQSSVNIELGKAFMAENSKKEGVITLPSGLQYEIIKKGTGKKPTVADQVQTHYHGTLIDGTIFDSSVDRGQPATFGVGQVIQGWQEGIPLMSEGAKYKFYIPQELAYGMQSPSPKIPAGSTLIFEVELLDIIPAPKTSTTPKEVATSPTNEEGIKFLEENAKKKGVITLPSGLQYMVIVKGNGPKPTLTDKVQTHYHGTLIDGTVFDSSVDRGQPATFGVNQVIKGWQEGIPLMSEGAKYRLFIPQHLAYGMRATGKIPAGSALIFDVELIKINPEN